jgi:hypothetical protein
MSPKAVTLWSLLVPLLAGPGHRPDPRAAEVRLTVATIHAAALTTPRAADDAEDGPYLLVSLRGPDSTTSTAHLPATTHLVVHRDQALGPQSLVALRLEPGDSVHLLLSLLEAHLVELPAEAQAANATTAALSQPQDTRAALLAAALAPLTQLGAHWLGSVALLVTNEGGTTYWRTFECVATCRVLTPPGDSALAAKATAGVVELSGSGGTYHLQLQGARVP